MPQLDTPARRGTLEINEALYAVEEHLDPRDGFPLGWRLVKQQFPEDGSCYDIYTAGGDFSTWTCDCPAFIYKSHLRGACKHAVALFAALEILDEEARDEEEREAAWVARIEEDQEYYDSIAG